MALHSEMLTPCQPGKHRRPEASVCPNPLLQWTMSRFLKSLQWGPTTRLWIASRREKRESKSKSTRIARRRGCILHGVPQFLNECVFV